MSDISLNVCPPAETEQTRASNKHGRKRKWLQKKRRQMETNNNNNNDNNDYVEGKQNKRHRRRKSGQKFGKHQRSASEERTLFSAPAAKLVRPSSTGSRYEPLTFTQNNNIIVSSSSSAASSSTPSTSAQRNISSAPLSSAASSSTPSTSAQRNISSAPLSSAASSSTPSASEQRKGLPHPALKPSAAAHSPPSQNHRGHCDAQSQLWSSALEAAAAPASSVASSHKQPTAKTAAAGIPTKYLAIDCEMVGTGPKGSISQLARCSVVNYEGDVVYDKFINPPMPVTDYRTRWSGIRRCDLINATPYAVARKEILKLLAGKVVIGHAVHNDFKVLGYSHPTAMTRDTARIPLLNQKARFEGNQSASLKRLTKAIFNRDIQTGRKGHSSVEDAKATMELYKVVEEEWERTLASRASSGPV